MQFKDVIGQEELCGKLRHEAQAGKTAHALLFTGPAGCGKLPAALALARYLLCSSPQGEEACGVCHNCRMTAQWAHPDLHFVFPVVRNKDTGKSVSDAFIDIWRKRLLESEYFSLNEWIDDMQAENQQVLIYSAESDAIQRKVYRKAAQEGKKVVIVWLPEKMNIECANKLLKIFEEPPADTHFILVSEDTEKILPTILSRTQQISFKAVADAEIIRALIERHGCSEEVAKGIAHMSHGNMTRALQSLRTNSEQSLFFDLFVILMRLSYQRKIKEIRKWSEQIANMGREKQKDFLNYCQRLIRENFIYNFRNPALNYETVEEENFSRNFARFINERNVIKIMDELSLAQRDIEQNVNPKFVFFDFALKMIVLLIQ